MKNELSPEVSAVFNSYPPKIKEKLLFLRQLIFETADMSYLTPESKSGSTIRIDWKEARQEQYSIFFKCTANLVPAFKEKFPNKFEFGGTRSIDFMLDDKIPEKELKQCIALALTYHLNKKLETTTRWKMVEDIA